VVIATGGATSWATQRFIVHPFKYSFIPDVKILVKCAANLNIVVTNPFVIPSLVNITHIIMSIDFLLHFLYSRVGKLTFYQSYFSCYVIIILNICSDAVYYDGKVHPLEEIDTRNKTWRQLHKLVCIASDATVISKFSLTTT
jgi:hypothetical protein